MSRVISRRSHGRSRMLRNPSMTICPASVPVSVAFCPENSSATAKSVARQVRAEQRRQQQIRVGDVRDALMAGAVERRRRHDENRAVEEERRHQRDGRVDDREADRLLPALHVVAVLPRLHDRRVQVQVVRHDRRAENADRDVEHVGIANDLRCWATSPARRRSGRAWRATARSRTTRRCPTISRTTIAST